MQRFRATKSENDRLAELTRCLGRAPDDGATADADRIRAAHPRLAPYLSDLVVAAAKAHFAQADRLRDAPEALLLKVIGWAHLVLPQTAFDLVCDRLELSLRAMAEAPAMPGGFPGLPITVLMQVVHAMRTPDGTATPEELLRWFYLEAVPAERLHRCIRPAEIEALNASQPVQGIRLLSLLDIWALRREPKVLDGCDLATPTGQIQAREAAWALREADPAFALYRSPHRPRAAAPPVPALRFAGRVAADPAISGRYRIEPGIARTFGTRQTGNALLLTGEWDVEAEFAWGLAPLSSLVFALEPDGRPPPRALGLTIAPYAAADTLGQTLTVFLNGVPVLRVPVADVLSRDAVACADLPFAAGLNLVQFSLDIPLVPSVQFGSADPRMLGIALRRFWVA